MKRFISLSCSRVDERSKGSASVCVLFPAQAMRPSGSLSCSREDDRLASKDLVRVLIAPEENGATSSPSFSLGSGTSRGHSPAYGKAPPSGQRAPTTPADLSAQRMRTQ